MLLRGKYYGLNKPRDRESTYFKLIWKTHVVQAYFPINDNSLECIGKGELCWNESWGLLGRKKNISRAKAGHLSDQGADIEWSWCLELRLGCGRMGWG